MIRKKTMSMIHLPTINVLMTMSKRGTVCLAQMVPTTRIAMTPTRRITTTTDTDPAG